MPIYQYQQEMIDCGTGVLDLPDADIEYQPAFLSRQAADSLYQHLLNETSWRQERITLYGKNHAVPRLSCWMADGGLDYSYSNMTMHPVSWSPQMLALKNELKQKTNHSFNSLLLNYYRDGQDSNGWHSDDEPELGSDPIIASITLGGVRDFQLKHKRDKRLKHSIKLAHGSLLIMSGRSQACWQHQIPKRAFAEPRINLTFRTLH